MKGKILILIIVIYLICYIIFREKEKETYNIVKNFEIAEKGKLFLSEPDFYYIDYDDKQYYLSDKNYKKYKNNINKNDLIFDKPIYEKINKINFKEDYPVNNSSIPKKIWQTFREEIKKDNPLYKDILSWKNQKGYEYNFLNDKQGEEFIKNNFDEDVLKAYKTLVPGAYKADLLRVCLIYIHGGVYADIKVKLNYPLDHFLDRDLVIVQDYNITRLWNGFFASVPKNPFLKKIIDVIVERVKNKSYGLTDTDITGPFLWKKEFIKFFYETNYGWKVKDNYRIMQLESFDDKIIISKINNHEPYMSFNKGYHKHYDIKKSYPILWNEKKVYDEKLWEEYFKN